MNNGLFIPSILAILICSCMTSDKVLSNELIEKTDKVILSKRIGNKFYAVEFLERSDINRIIECINVKFVKKSQYNSKGDYKIDFLNSTTTLASLEIVYNNENSYVNFSSNTENFGYHLNYQLGRYIDETISVSSLITDKTTREKALEHYNLNEWIRLDSISIEEFVNLLPIQNYSPNTTYILTTVGSSNDDWIGEEEIKYLMKYINSEQPAHCVMQTISSDLPIGETSTVGGQIQNIIFSYIENESYPNGLTLCDSSNHFRIQIIEEWIKNKGI